jgi:acyl-[acyl carrier protein]--UDP-N-acetylglucosamine O-acyltransferase
MIQTVIAKIGPDAKIGPGVSIGAYCVIESDVEMGAGCPDRATRAPVLAAG